MAAVMAEQKTNCKVVSLFSDWDKLQPAWDKFVELHRKGSAFHTSALIRVFAAAKNNTPVALAAVTDSGELQSLLVATHVQTLPQIFGSLSSRTVSYAEPLCYDTSDSIDSLCRLIKEQDRLLQRRALFAEVRPLHAAGPERVALERCGYQYLDYLNFVLDVTRPLEAIWKRLHDSAQSQVRKCERRGYEFRVLDSPKSVDVLYDFLRRTYSRAGVPLADRSLFESAYEILAPLNMIKVVAVYDGHKPIAADAMLLFGEHVFAWYGGSLRMKGHSPFSFLQWREIEWSHANGFKRYDFGGAGWPNIPYGVRDFKASFGGELVCYGRYRKVYSPWKMALAEKAYQIGRTVVSAK